MTLNHSRLAPKLKKIGLSYSEISTYLSAVSIGLPQTSGVLAKRAKLKQTTTTMALQSLIKKGLVTVVNRDKSVYYSAESPSQIVKFLERKEDELQQLKDQTLKIIPEIEKMVSPYARKPKIKIFEGAEGIKQVFMDMMDLDDEILGYASLSREQDEPFDDFWKDYFRKVVFYDKKIKLFVSDSEEAKIFKDRDKDENRSTVLVPQKQFFIKTEKHIVGDTIANISLHPDCLMAVVIKDKQIVGSEKAMFNFTWQLAQGKQDHASFL